MLPLSSGWLKREYPSEMGQSNPFADDSEHAGCIDHLVCT